MFLMNLDIIIIMQLFVPLYFTIICTLLKYMLLRIVVWYEGIDLRSEVSAVVPDLDPDLIGV